MKNWTPDWHTHTSSQQHIAFACLLQEKIQWTQHIHIIYHWIVFQGPVQLFRFSCILKCWIVRSRCGCWNPEGWILRSESDKCFQVLKCKIIGNAQWGHGCAFAWTPKKDSFVMFSCFFLFCFYFLSAFSFFLENYIESHFSSPFMWNPECCGQKMFHFEAYYM